MTLLNVFFSQLAELQNILASCFLNNTTIWMHNINVTCHVSKLTIFHTLPTVWVKKIPPWGHDIFHFFHKRLRIFNRFFTHLLYVPIFARLQIFMQLYPTLTKLRHIKRDCLVHVICAKCPPLAETHACRRLCKSLIALLIVVCGKSL